MKYTDKKTTIAASNGIIFRLKVLAREKETVRRKLEVTAKTLRLKAKQLAMQAREKEGIRGKLEITAKQLAFTAQEKETVRTKLVQTAKQLAVVAKEKENIRRKLVAIAREKEGTRRKLATAAEAFRLKARQLSIVAKEKEAIRINLEITAKDLAHCTAIDEAMLESIGDGLLATDEKGNITLINKAAKKLLDKKSEEVMGKTFSGVFVLEDEKGTAVPIKKHPISLALADGTTTSGITYYYKRKDATTFPLAITATPVILEDKVIGAIKVFRDITREREIDKAKSEFVSLTSHQLKTPATIVSLYVEQLLKEFGGKLTDKQKEYVGEIQDANGRMVDIVNTLLNISRIEMGIFSMEVAPVDIIAFLKNSIAQLQTELTGKKIVLEQTYHTSGQIILIDKILLNMVFSNLVSNSIRYTLSGGTISVKSLEVKKGAQIGNNTIKENSLLVSVSDNGCGIPKDQQDKIFTKFFRSDNARNQHTDGTGLGLYIVKSIVNHIGGQVWFLSKEKEGTTFYFTIPLGNPKRSKVIKL